MPRCCEESRHILRAGIFDLFTLGDLVRKMTSLYLHVVHEHGCSHSRPKNSDFSPREEVWIVSTVRVFTSYELNAGNTRENF